jgi:hypothetical protein
MSPVSSTATHSRTLGQAMPWVAVQLSMGTARQNRFRSGLVVTNNSGKPASSPCTHSRVDAHESVATPSPPALGSSFQDFAPFLGAVVTPSPEVEGAIQKTVEGHAMLPPLMAMSNATAPTDHVGADDRGSVSVQTDLSPMSTQNLILQLMLVGSSSTLGPAGTCCVRHAARAPDGTANSNTIARMAMQ